MMNQIFDNRQLLQSIVIYGGNKISVTAPSGKHSISIEDVNFIFLQQLNSSEINAIQGYLEMQKKNKFDSVAIEDCCSNIIAHSLNTNRGFNRSRNIALKEYFIERVLSEGCANAIILLHKFYYPIIDLKEGNRSVKKEF